MDQQPNGGARVLYVVYWGALEPLGQTLVLPAVRELAALGSRITLVTFEKPADLEQADEVARVRALLSDAGVQWVPLGYHKRPKLPATMLDFAHGVGRALLRRSGDRPDVVHGRTFIGGLIGSTVARLTGASLVYHNEGFYPDEQVDAGVWAAGSMPHRIARRLERRLYTRADAIFSLSNRGKSIIESLDGVRERGTPVVVVPSCVDLDHFRPRDRRTAGNGPLRLVYVGSVGGRYLIDRVGEFARVAREQRPDTQLRLITHADPGLVRETLDSSGLEAGAWSAGFVPYERLPDELAGQDAGFSFHRHDLSAAGGSSTKVGEYWAMGLPVVSTRGLGDVDRVVEGESVGIIVRDHTDAAYQEALQALLSLLADPELPGRCRRAAERHYGLEAACERQMKVYEGLAGGRHRGG